MKKVYIPMTADLFHVGHLKAIRKCAKQGLVYVGLVSDKCNQNRTKGKPVIPFEQRKEILEALPEVKQVLKQDSLDFAENVNKVKADFVAFSDELEKSEKESLARTSAKLFKFDYYKPQSTTKIKEKVYRAYLKKNAFDNLYCLKKVFDNLGIEFLIVHGLLLGIYREGGIIKNDEDDQDIYIWAKDTEKVQKAFSILEEKGFELNDKWFYKDEFRGFLLKRNTSKIDIGVLFENDEDYFAVAKNRDDRVGDLEHYVYRYSKAVFNRIGKIEWRGIAFNCPKNVELFLEERYGKNWETPNRRQEGYYLYDFENNPCLRGNYKI